MKQFRDDDHREYALQLMSQEKNPGISKSPGPKISYPEAGLEDYDFSEFLKKLD